MQVYTLRSKYFRPVGTAVDEVPTEPCVLYIAAGRFPEVNKVITSEYKLVVYVSAVTNIEKIRSECKCELTIIKAKDYLLHYNSMEMKTAPTYSVTPLDVEGTFVNVVGEVHVSVPCIMNWRLCQKKLLVLFEAGNCIYNVKPWSKLWLRDKYFAYWYKEHGYENDVDFEIGDPKPYNPNITFIPCDIRESVSMNPIIRPYFLIPWFCSSTKRGNIEHDKEMFKLMKIPHHPTIEDVKASGFYNKELPDEYYQKLIEKYSFDTIDEMKTKIETAIFSNSFAEFYKDATFQHPANEVVLKWFDKKCSDFMRYYGCINDIFTLSQFINNYKDYPLVLIYGGGSHSPTFVQFLLETFDRPYNNNIDEIFEHIHNL